MNGNDDHSVAVWAGVTTLLVNFAAINVARLVGADSANPGEQAFASLITALFVAGGVYSKQRWDEARRAERKRSRRKGGRQ